MNNRKLRYDREHSKKQYHNYKIERTLLIEEFGGCCEICSDTDQLHFHHKYYDEHSNYPRTTNGWSRIKRIREAKQFPEKFALLCNSCHSTVHRVLKNFDKFKQILTI